MLTPSPLLVPARLLITALLVLATPAHALEVAGGVTSLRFDPGVLSDLGIALVDVEASAAPLRDGALGFRVGAGSHVGFDAPPGDFERFDTAQLHHTGGFALRVGGETLRFPGVRISQASPPFELALTDAIGQDLLLTQSMHARLGPSGLEIAHADLLLAPALALRLGRPELAGTYVGVLDARLEWETPAAATGVTPEGTVCTPNIGPPVDLELTGLGSLSQAAREAGGRVAMAPRAVLRNLGPGDVAWNYAIAPDSPLGPHPFLALAFYRLSTDGVLEQIGRADVKHAFFSINTACDCPGDNVMYVGCADVYGVNTNLNRRYLAPRDEIGAFARSWTSLGSHFDATPVDDTRDHFDADHDAFEHRLVVHESDLQTPDARYFYEAWYLAAGDTDLANSLGHREVAPSLGGSTWSFPEVDGGIENGSMLDLLVDPVSPPAGSDNRWLDTGEGRIQLVAWTEDLGGGVHRYVYTLMNFDFDRALQSFTVPLESGQTVIDTGFSDSDAEPGNDWTVSVVPAGLRWTAPAGNALTWGGLYGFRAEVDAAPVATAARLTALDPGTPDTFFVATLAPADGIAAVPGFGPHALPLAVGALALIAWRWSRRHARRGHAKSRA